ncbi:unnamed protein product [Rotaria sp. Silwood1]|nr:unnamed protein product [Rotaria sp. Silwood1]CAF1029213.1 unnamed protein product [Rotaria sp. Silwood1]CAF3406412.1 unnamed protein product [Rotaria sp. Silwood1]CAF4819331.1 unnamed protein product [Rotaria sp. Silwood1]
MQLRKQDKMTVNDEQENGTDETTNGDKSKISNMHLTDADKEKGNFKNFNISKQTIKKLQNRNVDFLFPVQAESYKQIYDQKDCLVQAYTGTGKTLAFSIPTVELLQKDTSFKLIRGRAPRVLILAPTRELTNQISDDFQSIVTDLSIVTIYGGKKYEDQEKSIRNGCDILVATPGRLKDIVDKGKLDLTKVKHVILDEVDRMLDMGFIDDVEEILGHIFVPNRETKPQFIVFSATMPDWVHKQTKKYMSKEFITIDLVKGNTQKTCANVEHLAVLCTYQDRAGVISSLVQIYSSNSLDGRAIVFCETKKEADELSVSHDIKAEAHVLHGDIPQDKRELVLKKFREGKYRLLITTDVAARGLDIPEVDLVIVTAPPKDVESYIHRSGRTGRAGAQGKCICLYKSNQTRDLKRVEIEAGIKFTRIEPPRTEDVLIASSADAAKALDSVTDEAKAHFRKTAEKILETCDAIDALSAALACISGTTNIVSRSLLTKKENYTTYMLSVTDEFKGPGLVFTMLRKCFGEDFDAKGNCSQVAFTKDYRNAVFDIPSELDEKLQSYWKDSPRIQMKPIKELPQLDESSRNGSRGFSRSTNGSTRGGSYAGNRHSDRSNACFKCQKEGHKSWECPEANGEQSQRKSGGNGCFKCGQNGHKSFECTETKRFSGREQSNGGCFNCGKTGHKSFDCPEPKKGRSSINANGRGGGVKRSFTGNRENGHSNGETSRKKIKFNDDDD